MSKPYRISLDTVFVPCRQVLVRVIARKLRRASPLPIVVETLECGHVVEDPGKHAITRQCPQCNAPGKYIKRPSSQAQRRALNVLLKKAGF